LRYRLRDEYLRFFFTFVEPNKAKINLRTRTYQFDRITAASWEPFIGLAFEQFVARNVSAVLSALGAIDCVGRIGTYWHRKTKVRQGVQIDLVIERDDGVTNLVECKWSKKPVGRAILDELSRKKSLYPNPGGHTLESVIVAAAGASKPVRDSRIPVVTLEDLYAPASRVE
jgi:AAA+ ATPase superfamily predicted ATPase